MKLTEYVATVQDMGKIHMTPVEIKADDALISACRRAGITPKECVHVFVQENIHRPEDVPAMTTLLAIIRGPKKEGGKTDTE